MTLPEEQPWWNEFVEAAESQTSLLQLSKQFGSNPVALAQAMTRAGIDRSAAKRPKTAPTPIPAPDRAARPRPEDQPWWPRFLEVAGSRSLLELGREFQVDPIELVAALERAGIDRDTLPAAPEAAPAPEPAAAAPAPAVDEAPEGPAAGDDGLSESERILLDIVVRSLSSADAGVPASRIAEGTDASHLAVRELLVALEKQGLVYRTGRARSTRWWLG